MKKDTKKNGSGVIVLILLFILALLIGGGYYCYQEFFTSSKNQIQVVSRIDNYPYYLNSNTTRLYKKYYRLLEDELKDSRVDEEKYASLLSELFVIDFYTLNNKITNQDIGGIQFISSALQEKFRLDSSTTVYKYVQNNLNHRRTQELPEVNKVEILDIKNESYEKKNFSDSSSFVVEVKVGYVKDLGYPKMVTLHLIHEEDRLVIVEFDESHL